MNRRAFMMRAGILAGSACLGRSIGTATDVAAPLLHRFKLSVITDCLSPDFGVALKTMRSYGLSWVEIRHVWGKYNTETTPEEVRRIRGLLDRYEFRCAQVDTALFKCTLPGTRPLAADKDTYSYAEQMDLLRRAIQRAHAWGTDKVRIFTFWRVARPESIFGRISDEVQKAAEVAKSGGIRLMVENEYACNVATGQELAKLLGTLPPNVGSNWDIGNGLFLGEAPYPAGYKCLDPKRIWNLHLKGVQCTPAPQNCRETFPDQGQIALPGILHALLADGYQGTLTIECEFRAPRLSQTETTRRALEGMLKMM